CFKKIIFMTSSSQAKRHSNHRAAGAVGLSAIRNHFIQINSSADCRPGGEALFVSFSVHSWFLFNPFQ
ncbi:MAG: hypothetical protein IKN52_07495, partial [Victivallales bacterium]|nr:hypothetical protein [Victivallales bacterium]